MPVYNPIIANKVLSREIKRGILREARSLADLLTQPVQ